MVAKNRKKEGSETAILFRPSSAERWLNCLGSTRLALDVPKGRRSSPAAQEGTAAHFVAEQALRGVRQPEEWTDRMVSVDNGMDGVFVDAEMAEKVRLYVDGGKKWRGPGFEERVEGKLTLSPLAPDDPFLAQVGGTADHLILDYVNRRLVVRDLKYGKGVVVNASSKQLKVYLLMALLSYMPPVQGWAMLIAEVTQPRLPREDEWVTEVTYTPDELTAFLGELYQALRDAVMPDAPLRSGDWCRWCPAAEICPVLANKALAVAQGAFGSVKLVDAIAETLETRLPAPPVYVSTEVQAEYASQAGERAVVLPDPAGEAIGPDDIAAWLDGRDFVEQWFKAVEQRAVRLLEAGVAIPGWILGTRSTHRRWQDPDAAAAALIAAGADPEKILKIVLPTLKSPKQVEDADKALKPLVKTLTFNPPGAPALLRDDGERAAKAPVYPALPAE